MSTTVNTTMSTDTGHPIDSVPGQQGDRQRFLSEAECHEIAKKLTSFSKGGGYTSVRFLSKWVGNVRWARNRISTSGEVRDHNVLINRNIRGAQNEDIEINDISDAALVAAARRAERLALLTSEHIGYDLEQKYKPEEYLKPKLFFDSTYQLDAGKRAAAAHHLMQLASDAGMLSAGYIEVSAHSMAFINSMGYSRYFQYTWAQYSVTVRDPKGTGSGWAGVDWPDWNRIEGDKISAIALDKCLKSRNPVAIEPGRYTTILETQAVSDFLHPALPFLDRYGRNSGGNDTSTIWPFNLMPGTDRENGNLGASKFGKRVIDERITISSDPMDPDCGFPPFSPKWNEVFSADVDVYSPAVWIKNGVIVNLPYPREFAIRELGKSAGYPNSQAIHMSGGNTSIDEMISTTKRGLLVTRFDQVIKLDQESLLNRGYTRDGLWLIEDGKISKPVKNMVFTESVLFAFNNVEQLGVPQRVFHPAYHSLYSVPMPMVVPPLKIKDFSFTSLADAI